ncbi:hypothetical protein ACVWXO_000531 [Bradyrhizobium sp. LM2.7]
MADVSFECRPQFEEKTKSDPRALAALRILWPSSAVDRSSARGTCSVRQPFCLPKNGSASRSMKLAKRLDTNKGEGAVAGSIDIILHDQLGRCNIVRLRPSKTA